MSAKFKDQSEDGTILFVEDDEAHASIVKRLFEKDSQKWKINHVVNIRDASNWIENNKCNGTFLVIADYLLPDGNGLDLAKGGDHPMKVGFPLIILTGFGSEKIAVRAFKCGAMDYVVKEADSFQMLPRIAKRVLRKWENIRETKLAEMDLEGYIKDLEEENRNLEELADKFSLNLEESMLYLQSLNERLMNKYAYTLESSDREYLDKVRISFERTNAQFDALSECLIPLFIDVSLVKLCSMIIQAEASNISDDSSERLFVPEE